MRFRKMLKPVLNVKSKGFFAISAVFTFFVLQIDDQNILLGVAQPTGCEKNNVAVLNPNFSMKGKLN